MLNIVLTEGLLRESFKLVFVPSVMKCINVKFWWQGLYEYVCPSWQTRARPSVEDYDVKSFGLSVPAIVMNPNSNPVKLPEIASGNLGEIKPPR